jgi:glycosyltransferase involved in cell wall biosynthesis
VVGTGPEARRLRRNAGPNISFRGWVTRTELRDLYRGARALVFPGREDSGIVPLEARACGCPVIAYDGGGAVESLLDGINAVLFREQTVAGLEDALERFDGIEWSDSSIRLGTSSFSRDRFKSEMERFVRRCWDGDERGSAPPASTPRR